MSTIVGLAILAMLLYSFESEITKKKPKEDPNALANKIMESRELQQAFLKGLWTQREKDAYDKWMTDWIEDNRMQERALRIERTLHKDGEIHFKAKA